MLIKELLELRESDTDHEAESFPKSGKLAINYGYGAERFDKGRPVTIIGKKDNLWIVEPFPIMASEPLSFELNQIDLDDETPKD